MDRNVRTLEFTCPKCGEHRIEEVMVNVTVASSLTDIVVDDEPGSPADMTYVDQDNEDGEIDRYQCMDCGHVLKDGVNDKICSQEELSVWMIDHESS